MPPPDERAPRAPLERVLWLALYLIVVLAPLTFLLVAPKEPGRTFGVDLAAGLGFGALTILALQLVLPARVRLFTQPFGVDVLLRFHRQVGFAALVLVLAHIAALMLDDPDRLALLNPFAAPWRAQAAAAATAALLGLVVTSLWRLRLRLSYEDWRGVHLVLGLAVLGFSLAHVIGVNEYVGFGSVWIATVLVVGAGAAAVFHLRLFRPRAAARRPYRVSEIRPERGGATTLVLVADGHEGTPFAPGQFAWLKLAHAPYALSEHPFSYASSAEHPARPHFTIKAAGDFTSAIRELEPGTPVLLDGPHGSFDPPHPDGGYLFIAGGIGITPILSFLRTFADRGDERPLSLVYASRGEDITFREELDDLEKRLRLRVVHVLSDPPPDWRGERGRVDRPLLERALAGADRPLNLFVCGPPALVDAVLRALRGLVPAEDVHAERFAAA